jgi:hypothetical protein
MTNLGRAVVEAVVLEYGRDEFLRRIADPLWFQALGCVMGMDWHSSGITTSVLGALKRGLNPIAAELGLSICGGRGRHSRRTPEELRSYGDRTGLDASSLVRASRLSAKVDNTCVQDGFSIYLHSFIVSKEGRWAVVQQGMNDETGMARRYHWHSAGITSFVSDPQSAVFGKNQGRLVNLSDARADSARRSIVDFLSRHPDSQLRELRHLSMPDRHDVRPIDVDSKRLGAVLALAHESQLTDFSDALLLKGVGPRTMQSLSLVSEVIYGAPSRFTDPARFSFAHGGKDGHPFPVPTKTYDETIATLRFAVERAKIGAPERMRGIKALSALQQALEQSGSPDADVDAAIAFERSISKSIGGRVVGGAEHPVPRRRRDNTGQLELFE